MSLHNTPRNRNQLNRSFNSSRDSRIIATSPLWARALPQDPMSTVDFASLGVSAPVLKAVQQLGYEVPSPIQAQSIPILLNGENLLGTAQTGTGKTAAFALPLLSRLDDKQHSPQILVLTPTRELAIQVAEAFQSYARHIKGFHVLPIYGGADIKGQLRGLKRVTHVVVGTPGRVLDHLRRRSLDLSRVTGLVLDEADEMLRMGFIDDVETILSKTPENCQRALFSATMPSAIRRVAQTYLGDAQRVSIEGKTKTVERIDQKYLMVKGHQKMDALTRILEVENFDGMLVFVRTKSSTVDIAEKLEARGFSSAALNGDLSQTLRERTISRLKKGQVDIVVATDVAARGLDVERISHVINYDVPYDNESYVHRIGRTGRAGRDGIAILFVTQKENRLLRSIEKSTRQTISPLVLPSNAEVSGLRIQQFTEQLVKSVEAPQLGKFRQLIETMSVQHAMDITDIAAALLHENQKDRPLFPRLEALQTPSPVSADKRRDRPRDRDTERKTPRAEHRKTPRTETRAEKSPTTHSRVEAKPKAAAKFEDKSAAKFEDKVATKFEGKAEAKFESKVGVEPEEGVGAHQRGEIPMVTYRIEVGNDDGITPSNIVGAIANEADIESRYIGQIVLHDDYSTVDLPDGMPKELFAHLRKVRICQKPLKISILDGDNTTFKPAPSSRKKSSGNSGKRPEKKPIKGTLSRDSAGKKRSAKDLEDGAPTSKKPHVSSDKSPPTSPRNSDKTKRAKSPAADKKYRGEAPPRKRPQ